MSIEHGRYRHGLRRMIARDVTERGRAATPLELLFDLTFVAAFGVAAAQLAHGIAAGHWQAAALAFVFAMFAIAWAWINVCWFSSAFDNDDWLHRLSTMVQMAGVIVLAIGLPALFASIEAGEPLDNRLMVAGYVIIRVALLLEWRRAVSADRRFRSTAATYALFVGVAQLGWILVAILPLTAVPALIAAAVLFSIEAAGPVVVERRREGSTPWHPHHLAERFALLTLIALGETVFGTLASAGEISAVDGWSVDAIVMVAAGVALSFALWWTYFLVPHGPVLRVRRRKAVAWGYAHIVLFVAIAAVGAGLHLVGFRGDAHREVTATAVVGAIAVPVVVFMIALYALQTWLVGAVPRNVALQAAITALPIVAIVLASAGAPVWACLLVVLASPVSIIAAFELGGWRRLDVELARVTGRVATKKPPVSRGF